MTVVGVAAATMATFVSIGVLSGLRVAPLSEVHVAGFVPSKAVVLENPAHTAPREDAQSTQPRPRRE